jgi:hypothetical protein
MRTYTNLAWPDDPYRASQQLYRRPGPMLAAFALLSAGPAEVRAPAALAVAYLPLHRSRAVTVTEGTVTFGFCAACADDEDGIPALASRADLDFLQARRHARFLAGHKLADSLHALRGVLPVTAARGLAAVEADWETGQAPSRGKATMIDVGDGGGDLASACRSAGIGASAACTAGGIVSATGPAAAGQTAAMTAERALVIALACARQGGLYEWDGTLSTARMMAAAAWDLFPDAAWGGIL